MKWKRKPAALQRNKPYSAKGLYQGSVAFLLMSQMVAPIGPVKDGSPFLPKAEANSFNDVNASHWAANYISLLVALGMIEGDGLGNFEPDRTVTKQEAVVMALRLIGVRTPPRRPARRCR